MPSWQFILSPELCHTFECQNSVHISLTMELYPLCKQRLQTNSALATQVWLLLEHTRHPSNLTAFAPAVSSAQNTLPQTSPWLIKSLLLRKDFPHHFILNCNLTPIFSTPYPFSCISLGTYHFPPHCNFAYLLCLPPPHQNIGPTSWH